MLFCSVFFYFVLHRFSRAIGDSWRRTHSTRLGIQAQLIKAQWARLGSARPRQVRASHQAPAVEQPELHSAARRLAQLAGAAPVVANVKRRPPELQPAACRLAQLAGAAPVVANAKRRPPNVANSARLRTCVTIIV
jgi:hypothetical protein